MSFKFYLLRYIISLLKGYSLCFGRRQRLLSRHVTFITALYLKRDGSFTSIFSSNWSRKGSQASGVISCYNCLQPPRPHFKPSDGFLGVFLLIKCFGRFQTPFRGFTLCLRFALCYSRPPSLSPHSTGKVLRVPWKLWPLPSRILPAPLTSGTRWLTGEARSSMCGVQEWLLEASSARSQRATNSPKGACLTQATGRWFIAAGDISSRSVLRLTQLPLEGGVKEFGGGVPTPLSSPFPVAVHRPVSRETSSSFCRFVVRWHGSHSCSTFDPLTSPKPICSRKR